MHTAERELHAACERGDVFACVTLLQRGVTVNCRDRHSEATPLIRAVHCNQVEIVNVLMQRREEFGCDIYQFDKQGFAGFHWAVMSGNVDIVSLMMFLDRSLLTRPDVSGRTPYYLCTLLRPNPEVSNVHRMTHTIQSCRVIL
jgi:ankyrin repeat protein